MATPVIMPRQGQSVESCIVTKWHKRVGDAVNEGDVIFSYETDKAAFDEEAKVSGTLLAVFFEEGDDVPVLTNICAVGAAGEDYSAFAPVGSSAGATAAPNAAAEPAANAAAAVQEASAATIPATQAASGGELLISPRARNLAEKTGLDPKAATPTGPSGRVIERDILALAASGQGAISFEKTDKVPPAAVSVQATGAADTAGAAGAADLAGAAGYVDVPLTGVRKAIAKSMSASLSNIPQLTHNISFDAANIMAYRALLKEKGEAMGLSGVTLGDIVLYAVSRTLLNHPDLNAHYLDTGIRQFKDVNLAFACDTPRGLLVPTIFGASNMSLKAISEAVKNLAAQAQTGKISPELLSGASFTVSNLGAFGIESFTPVINPPQTGILGVNTLTDRVRKRKDGSIEVYKSMGLSLTYDHRAVDGAPASRFLQELKQNLENFSMMLAK